MSYSEVLEAIADHNDDECRVVLDNNVIMDMLKYAVVDEIEKEFL